MKLLDSIMKSTSKRKIVFSVIIVISVMLISFPLFVKANTNPVGAGAMLRTGVDARALGMGGAFVAIANSYSASYWNPAGITRSDSIYLGGMNLDKFGLGLNYNYLSSGTPQFNLPLGDSSFSTNLSGFLPQAVSFSGSYSGFSTEVQAYTDTDGDDIPEPVGKIIYSERLFKGNTGFTIPRLGSIGLGIKNYRFRAPNAGKGGKDATANGLGFDLGFLSEPLDNFWVGAAGFDLSGALQLRGDLKKDQDPTGTEIYWKNTPTEPTNIAPARYSLGAAYSFDLDKTPLPKFVTGNTIISGQYTLGPYITNKIRAGIEYNLSILSLRAGTVKPAESEWSFTAGAGLAINLINFDVAWFQNNVVEGRNTSDTIIFSSEFAF